MKFIGDNALTATRIMEQLFGILNDANFGKIGIQGNENRLSYTRVSYYIQSFVGNTKKTDQLITYDYS